MRYKEDVIMYNMHRQIDRICLDDGPLDQYFHAKLGRDCWVTSGRNGRHMKRSLHWKGRAIDIRTWGLSDPEGYIAAKDINKLIGSDFDVIYEEDPDHIHIEWDPKTARQVATRT